MLFTKEKETHTDLLNLSWINILSNINYRVYTA